MGYLSSKNVPRLEGIEVLPGVAFPLISFVIGEAVKFEGPIELCLEVLAIGGPVILLFPVADDDVEFDSAKDKFIELVIVAISIATIKDIKMMIAFMFSPF